jgi:hypothetical protein
MTPNLHRAQCGVLKQSFKLSTQSASKFERSVIVFENEADCGRPTQFRIRELARSQRGFEGDALPFTTFEYRPSDFGLGPAFGIPESHHSHGLIGLAVRDDPSAKPTQDPVSEELAELDIGF